MLEMAMSTNPDRVAVVSNGRQTTVQELSDLADGGSGVVAASRGKHVAYLGTGGLMMPLLLFASARAGQAFSPLNYRLSLDSIRSLVDRLPTPLVVVDSRYRHVLDGTGKHVMESDEFLDAARTATPSVDVVDPRSLAMLLFTSGTTSTPKAVELSHNNLTNYVTGTVGFDSAEPGDAAIICVPPYHIAGVGAALSNLYAGRKMVYLCEFDAQEWIRLVNKERATTATVVPTMLDRILEALERGGHQLPTLRNLAYGGAKAGLPLVRRAIELLPHVGLVNAYGLTETSSTIAVLTPEDHRTAHTAEDPVVARRLSSVGRPVPGVEVEVRGDDGMVAGPGQTGELFVRGEQVSVRYAGLESVLDDEGWFPTKDLAFVDEEGYLFIVGRADDTIIRGGENIAPAEIEDVLIEHPDIHEVAVVGVDDPQWGQAIVAVVVLREGTVPRSEDLIDYTRKALRGSRTPDRVVYRDELPTTATGKVLRHVLAESLGSATQRSQTDKGHA